MKINLENIQDISHFGLKILCDGHVTVQGMLNNNRLKMRLYLCDAYVTEQKIKISSSINFSFDCITYCTTKNVIYNSFSMRCLFNGYLTESVSYANFEQMAYLTGSGLEGIKTYLNALCTRLSLFTGYLIELHFNAHGGLNKMWQMFGNQTGEIINELSDTLAE